MNIVLWILAGVLAAVYLLVGAAKIATPKVKLGQRANMGWTEDFTETQIKGIGAAEVLGAIGLVLPWATGILPFLTPIAAIGLVVVQVGAAVTHYRRGEAKVIPGNVVLLVMAAVVAVGRLI